MTTRAWSSSTPSRRISDASAPSRRSAPTWTAGRHAVALEGNLPHTTGPPHRYTDRLVLEFGTVPGGYGWIFPSFTWLHTHAADDIIHTESPVNRTYTLGEFFDS
jgi:hypothetical protein